MIITVGKTTPRVLNPQQIVYVELHKGKVTAFVSGDNDGDRIVNASVAVREPWSVEVRTLVGTGHINCADFDTALSTLIEITHEIYPGHDLTVLAERYRKTYGK